MDLPRRLCRDPCSGIILLVREVGRTPGAGDMRINVAGVGIEDECSSHEIPNSPLPFYISLGICFCSRTVAACVFSPSPFCVNRNTHILLQIPPFLWPFHTDVFFSDCDVRGYDGVLVHSYVNPIDISLACPCYIPQFQSTAFLGRRNWPCLWCRPL